MIKIERKTNNLEKLENKIKAISKAGVNSGYFSSQQDHQSGIPYAEIMNIHEYGFHGNPSRPVRQITFKFVSNDKRKRTSDLKDYFYWDKPLSEVLDGIGWKVTATAYDVFGDSGLLAVTSNPTPLVDTSELRNAWSWNTSLNNFLKGLEDV